MPSPVMTNGPSSTRSDEGCIVEIRDPGVIWSAIFGGTVAASAFLLIMAPLGSSLGFIEVSPWHAMDTTQKTFTLMSAIWLILMQWMASGIGGYLTGRLRTGWADAHTHEVFFRDTAHGFLTWALATIVGMVLLAAGMTHATETEGYHRLSPENFAASRLLHTDQTNTAITEQDLIDASYTLMRAADSKSPSDADRSYLEQLVLTRTGLSPADAQKRVDNTINQLKESEHTAHKALAIAGLFIFLSMWLGAFIASAAGALGGQHRDLHYTTGSLTSV